MTVAALIPARGGSKAISDKNLVKLAGVPLVARSIEQAFHATAIDQVWVSSDSEEILDVASMFGARAITRPGALARDNSPTEDAIEHALPIMDADLIVLLQPTSPLRLAWWIDEAIAMMDQFDSVLSVHERQQSFEWAYIGSRSIAVNYDPAFRPMRQELAPHLVENGNIYVFRRDMFEEERCRLGGRIGLYKIPPWAGLEIDTPDDLKLVRWVYHNVAWMDW